MTEPVLAPPWLKEDWRRDALAAALFGMIPVLGVLVWGWSPLALLLLFGFENLVIGLRQLTMMLLVARARPEETLGAVGQAFFFLIHYGGFCAAHLFFSILLVYTTGPSAPAPDADGSYAIDSGEAFAQAFNLTASVLLGVISIIAMQILNLVEFVRRREAQTVSLHRLMSEPYIRVAVLHVVVIGGSAAVLSEGLPPKIFVVLALYKLAVDVGEVWWRAHRKPTPRSVADLPAPTPGVAFDVANGMQGKSFLYFCAAFVAVGLLTMAFGNVAGGLVWTGLTALISGLAALMLVNAHRKLLRSLHNGTGRVVEGRVENFKPRPRDGRDYETFYVNDVKFSYADNIITGGLNKSALRGGPIREGLSVRIHYLPTPTGLESTNVIARLEVLT